MQRTRFGWTFSSDSIRSWSVLRTEVCSSVSVAPGAVYGNHADCCGFGSTSSPMCEQVLQCRSMRTLFVPRF